ncbi:MAG: class I SAM-dependent methyltransferase [Candidatus Helarchaeota archaeon]|nr:class I SAM-dependent methyltransferase [Candidatus Helarchaeota archaeon]
MKAGLGKNILSIDETVRYLRSDPQYADIVHNSYVGKDVHDSAQRFTASAEFTEVLKLLGKRVSGGVILDLGAGTGIASYAFCRSGASTVYALEPDPSQEVGRGAIERLPGGLSIQVIAACGEAIPLPEEEVHIVYTRQVLHHARDLSALLKECARVLKPGGIFLACREHVVDNDRQLRKFLRTHPMHQLAGGENAFRLDVYLNTIHNSGLTINKVLGPYDSIINAFPEVSTMGELEVLPRIRLERRFGRWGGLASSVPLVNYLVWKWLKRSTPGRLYSFLATKQL